MCLNIANESDETRDEQKRTERSGENSKWKRKEKPIKLFNEADSIH